MTDSALYCCGRSMTVIGVDKGGRPDGSAPAVGVRLHSCPGCGRHAWRRDGREVDRAELLDALRPPERTRTSPPPRRPAAAARAPEQPAPTPEQERAARREELQRMLAGFQVHGSTP